jgi:hypothetical protein
MSGWSIVGEVLVDFRSIKVSDHSVHYSHVIPISPLWNWMRLSSESSDTKVWVVGDVESTFFSLWEEVISEEDNGEKNDCLEN